MEWWQSGGSRPAREPIVDLTVRNQAFCWTPVTRCESLPAQQASRRAVPVALDSREAPPHADRVPQSLPGPSQSSNCRPEPHGDRGWRGATPGRPALTFQGSERKDKEETVSYDLISENADSLWFSIYEWPEVMDLAEAYGWKPLGTKLHPGNVHPAWRLR